MFSPIPLPLGVFFFFIPYLKKLSCLFSLHSFFNFSMSCFCFISYSHLFSLSPHTVFTSSSLASLIFPCCHKKAAVVGEVFATSSSSHFSSAFLWKPPSVFAHKYTHPPASISSFIPSFYSLPVCSRHKCICSIPPANRLAGCYQWKVDSDNGFHHIFSLQQIKMGQVICHTNTRTHTFCTTNSIKKLITCIYLWNKHWNGQLFLALCAMVI